MTGLTEKYRPKGWDGVLGNETTVRSLRKVLSRPGKPHSYLLTGPKGCGKTTIARIMAAELGASGMDVKELNSANYRGVDSARELLAELHMRPWQSKATVWILDECHQITGDAQNTLLKALEAPPSHAFFVLCTTDPEKMKETLISRCARYQVFPCAPDTLMNGLRLIVKKEGCPAHCPSERVLDKISRACEGIPRTAVMLLDQVLDIEDEEEALAVISSPYISNPQAVDLCRAIVQNRPWEYVSGIISSLTDDPESVRHAVLGYANTVMLARPSETLASIIRQFSPTFMHCGKAGLTLACWLALKANPANRAKIGTKPTNRSPRHEQGRTRSPGVGRPGA